MRTPRGKVHRLHGPLVRQTWNGTGYWAIFLESIRHGFWVEVSKNIERRASIKEIRKSVKVGSRRLSIAQLGSVSEYFRNSN